MKSMINSLLAATILLTSVAPASAIQGHNGELFFRYKDPVFVSRSGGGSETESKSVTVFYVAGVGFPFEELLPLKPEWQDDNWRVVSGNLPDGIEFDAATRTFRGTPTQELDGQVVNLEGFDSAGNFVAKAKVTFDVVTLQGIPVPTELYAHTGFYKVDELPRPAGMPDNTAIESWAHVYALPGGMDLDNRYIQGTPTKAGTYRLLITGKDYKGEVVATYYGKYIVEDGPTFPFIADKIDKLPQLEWGFGLWRDISAPAAIAVNHQIDPNRAVRYFLEMKDGKTDPLPEGVFTNSLSLNLLTRGWATKPYDTSTVRLKAVDVDGTTGYSNWFTFGTSDPQPDCNPFAYAPFTVLTGVEANIEVPRMFGSQGDVFYKLASGTLPAGLSFEEGHGRFVGVPEINGDDQDVTVTVDVTNGEHVVTSRECKYRIEVRPGGVGFSDLTDPQDRHVRTGDYYDGTVGITGGIPDFTVSFTDPSALPYLSFLTPTENTSELEIGGETVDKGLKTVNMSLANGDGFTHYGSIGFQVHDPLHVDPVPDLHVKRLEHERTWASLPYDAETVIPDVVGGDAPKITFSNIQALPIGLSFDEAGNLVGSTSEPAGIYGPFTATVSDFSGQTVTSNEFNVVVDERAPIELTANGEPKFSVEWDADQTITSFSARQPHGARELALTWTLATSDGSALPEWLSIDSASGNLTVAAGVSNDLVGKHGPYVVSVSDTDGASASLDFQVELAPWPTPTQKTSPLVKGNVAGTSAGETLTAVPFPDLRSIIDEKTVIGGPDRVTFRSATPSAPAGLTFNAAAATFTGTPTESFEGPVTVEFEDARGRAGTMVIDLDVKPYPEASIQQNFDLPRNADAEKLDDVIKPDTNDGFWNKPVWSVDTTRGTDIAAYGLNVDPASGILSGRTDAPVGTVIPDIVLLATSIGANGEVLKNWTEPFSVTVAAPIPMVVGYAPAKASYFLEEGTMAFKGSVPAVPTLKGSYKGPVTWTADAAGEAELASVGLSLNPANGEIAGIPTKFGSFEVLVTATDSEGTRNAVPGALRILVTKSGDIRHDGTSTTNRVLRVGEPFTTKPIAVTNEMPPVVFSISPAVPDLGVTFSSTTGAFEEGSRFVSPGFKVIYGNAVDRDERTFGGSPVPFSFDVKPELRAGAVIDKIKSRQYSPETEDAINTGLGVYTVNAIGDIRYTIDGAVPGTLVYRDENGLKIAASGQPVQQNALPDDAIVFDTLSASLTGIPSKAGTFTFTVIAHDDHADAYEMDDPTRIANNTAVTNPVTITVDPASPVQLVSSENPKGVVVPGGNGIMSVTPRYDAYGKPAAFTVSGADRLPPGITYKADGTGVYFSGKFNGTTQQLGSYTGITVGVTDALGRTASLPVSFNVFLSSDAIGLTMTSITTKVGYPVEMQSVADNYYGSLRFYSYDLSGPLGSQVALNGGTGLVSGTFTSVADHVMNVYVTDATNRVTSKPLQIKVIPDLKITVPTTVEVEQSRALNRTILTDYRLGKVTYEKANPAAWPEGFSVDPDTGSIINNNVTIASGTYPGLQIRAVDSFKSAGTDHTDVALSNTFAIVVTDITAAPVIGGLGKQILGTVGEAVALAPYVYDDVTWRPWTYEGTVFEASHDLSEYGLTFDSKTGKISGIATKWFVIPDFVLTVTSKQGISSSTAPFWLGVAPADPITLAQGQPLEFVLRGSNDFGDVGPIFDNVAGKALHTIQAFTGSVQYEFDRSTGALTPIGEWPEGRYGIYQTVHDEFSRMAGVWRYFTVGKALSLTGTDVNTYTGRPMNSVPTVSAAGVVGTATYSISGLPSGLTFDPATGSISGSVTAEGSYPLTISVTDSSDGSTASTTLMLVVAALPPAPRYWRASWLYDGAGYPSRVEQFRLFDASGNNIVPGLYNSGVATALTDGVYSGWGSVDSIFQVNQGAAHLNGKYIGIDLGPNPPPVSVMSVIFYGSGSPAGDVTFSYSTDGENWTPFAHNPGSPTRMDANYP